MKKIPCLLQRKFYDNHTFELLEDKITPGCEWVIAGEGFATEKLDGTACMIKNGCIYKRYDAKKGKQPPKNAIPCIPEPDPITGHWPHWVKCDENKAEDKYHIEAFDRLVNNKMLYRPSYIIEGTYELIGPHFQSNPYNLEFDILEKHGERIINVGRSIEEIKEYLNNNYIEGIVFWKDGYGSEMCKIRRKDFGFKWNEK